MATKSDTSAAQKAQAPSVLADLNLYKQWVGYNADKQPLNPRGSGKAKADDPSTWGTRALAEKRSPGKVGIEFGPIVGRDDLCLAGVDLDGCRDLDTKTIAPWAEEIIAKLGTYTELSPSGKGLHALFLYRPSDMSAIADASPSGTGGQWKPEKSVGIEFYFRGRYFTVTDDQFGPRSGLKILDGEAVKWIVSAGDKLMAGNVAEFPKERTKKFDEAATLRDLMSGASYHPAAISLGGYWARTGVPIVEAHARLKAAFEAIDEGDRDDRWKARFKQIPEILQYAYGKEAADEAGIVESFDKHANDNDGAGCEAYAHDTANAFKCAGMSYEEFVERLENTFPNWSKANAPFIEAAWRDAPSVKVEVEVANSKAADLNALHAVVIHRGKTLIMTKQDDGSVGLGSVSDLHHRYDNQRAVTEAGKTREPISKRWMRSPKRITYPAGLIFDPSDDLIGTPGAYNLWRGFPKLKSTKGVGCNLFLAHTLDIICNGDQANFDWLMKWLAHLIQYPEVKPGTAVILKAIFGAGKDIWGTYVGKLLGRHHVGISQPEHLTGHFNAHMETALLLHVEEGFWAGDRKAESVLKSLITSDRVMIERKGIDAIPIANFVRILITSNKDWIVPAAFKDRRFFVLNVSDSKAKDTDYFGKLAAERDSGGAAALFDHLKGIDLTGFDVRNPPVTDGLRDQILAGLKNIDRWWRDILDEGELPIVGDFGEGWSAGAVDPERAALRAAYEHWMDEPGRRFEGDKLGPKDFGTRFRALVPGLQDCQPRIDGIQKRAYRIPSLATCRAAFEARFEMRDGSELI